MLRIAFVTPIFPTTAEPFRGTYNYKLVEALQKKADVEVFCATAKLPMPGNLLPRSVTYLTDKLGTDSPPVRATYVPYPSIRALSRPLNGIACARRLRPFLERHKPDLVFAPWVQPEGYGALRVSKPLGIPVVIGALGSDLRRVADPLSRRIVRYTLRSADAVITVSRELKSWAVGFGANADTVYPVLNGCDFKVFYPRERGECRRALTIPADCELAVFVGMLIPTKGLRELAQAATALMAKRPRMRVAIVGAGPLREWLDHYVADSPYRDRFYILGQRSAWEIAEWLGAANFFCLPSYSEGCPNVVLEALACGRPVVATEIGGIPEIVPASAGILIPRRDPEKLRSAMDAAFDRVWDEENIRRTSGRSWDMSAEETLAVLQATHDRVRPDRVRLLASKPPARRVSAPPARPRIAVISSFFPSAAHPHYGNAVFRTVQALARMATVQVIGPTPISFLAPDDYRIDRILPPGRNIDSLAVSYAPYLTIPVIGRVFNGRWAARAVASEVRAFRPDVILSFWIYPDGYAAVRIARELRVPVIVGARGSDLRRPGALSIPLIRSTVRSADAVITVSEDLRAHAIDAGAAPERVHTVLNGIEQSLFFLRDRAAVRPLLGLAGDRRLIAFVGRLSAAKGVSELLAACGRLFDRLPDVDLAVIGSGQMAGEVNAFAARYPQRVRIMHSCTRSEVGQWIAAADVFTLPSYSEGCPNVVIEALASGRPVVATNVGGIPELITPSNGILVQPKDVEGLDRALEDALNRHWDHAAISAAWQRNWTDVAAETLRVCAELLGQEPRSPEHSGGVRPEAVV